VTHLGERLGQLLAVTGEDLRVVRPARDRDVSHPVVDEVFRAKICIDVDEHVVGGLPLAGVAGYGIAMVKVRMFSWVDAHTPATVHLQTHTAIVGDALDGSQLTIRNLQVSRRRGELDAVAHRKSLLLLLVDGNVLLTAWIVGLF
jgi:hypothetical protein